MKTLQRFSALTVALLLLPLGASPLAAAPAFQAGGQQARGGGGPGGGSEGPKEYSEVITEDAVTQEGLFKVHRVGEDLFFEIPPAQLMKEMMLIGRPVESTTQDPGSFFGGGARLVVQWERMGDRVVLREREYDVTADPNDDISLVVGGFLKGPVLATYDVEAYAPDSSAVIDVTDLFISNIPELRPVESINRGRSWVDRTWAFPTAINVEVTQSGQSRPSGNGPGGGGPGGFGGGNNNPQFQTVKVQFSMMPLPDEPMMPRWHDNRVGFNSSRSWDFSRPDNRLEQVRFIHRFRLEKQNPGAEVSDPVEPIVYWIDPATPDWLKPWIVRAVSNVWQSRPSRRPASANAIFGRVAPSPGGGSGRSPSYDARHSAIYWRPSTGRQRDRRPGRGPPFRERS